VPPNDAHLVRLGQRRTRKGINVSSCGFVVTLHGSATDEGEREEIEAAVRAVPGVRDVTNRLRLGKGDHLGAVSELSFRGI
jgi:osmotically-inducible protein OsmY